MFRECKLVAQTDGEPFRRWFVDDTLDPLVWYSDQTAKSIVGFQLTYTLGLDHYAMTWFNGRYSHAKVEESPVGVTRYKWEELLPDRHCDTDSVLRQFRAAGAKIEPAVQRLVCEKIQAYPQPTARP